MGREYIESIGNQIARRLLRNWVLALYLMPKRALHLMPYTGDTIPYSYVFATLAWRHASARPPAVPPPAPPRH
jgi:hypothetical protein